MRIPTPIQVLSAAAALALLAGCSGGSAITPKPSTPQGHVRSMMGHVPALVGPIGALKINTNSGRHLASYNICPAVGPLTYISDFNNSVIDIYLGPFALQLPCAVMAGGGLLNPQGLFVRMPSHRLFVANTGASNILEFAPRGGPLIGIFTDPTLQYPADVTVAHDGTVIASNIFSLGGAAGSISTWHINGAFVGNFPMVNDIEGLFVTVQLQGPNKIFYNDIDATSGTGVVYTGNCPGGFCGPFVPTPATTNTTFPGGLRSRANDTRLIQIDQVGGGVRLRYNDINPLFPPGVPCNIGGSDPVGFDMNGPANSVFYADAGLDVGGEIVFGNCLPIGTVPVGAGGLPIGAAHDIPEPI